LADAVPLVGITGRLAGVAAAQMRHIVHTQLADHPRLMVLDLRAVVALPPDGVAALVAIAYAAGDAEIGLCLVCGDGDEDAVLAGLRDAGVVELFEIQPDLDTALDTLP
jgi:anti-anti-sigma regulatory factor